MQQQYASFGRRFVAVFLDFLIVGIPTGILNYVLTLVLQTDSTTQLAYVLNIAAGFGYYVLYQSKAGQTLGKKVLGVKVVNAEGHTPSMITFFLREFIGKLVSGLILGIGYLWPLWDKNKQALHDKIASTFVVRV